MNTETEFYIYKILCIVNRFLEFRIPKEGYVGELSEFGLYNFDQLNEENESIFNMKYIE